jgi:mono/diheme cytochrome c family protein
MIRPALVLAVLAVALPAAGRKPLPWEKNSRIGQDLYREHCVVCHDIDKPWNKASKKPGPSLYRLFQNDKLPLTGAKPSRDYVAVKIKFGGQIMPPFVKRMTDAEVNAVVDYIEAAGRK